MNKMSSELVNWISIIGSFLSLIGVIIALVQISKTRRAAEAAKDASLQTQNAISRNLLLSDVSTCVKHIEELKSFVRSEKYELALLRVNDLISQLSQIRERNFEDAILKLSNIRKDFERKIAKSSAKIKTAEVISQLAFISDDFNKLIGETKIAVQRGEQNG